ncbi:MAG: hypothetical protein AAGC96_10675 [Pseudomonadota bacterium]
MPRLRHLPTVWCLVTLLLAMSVDFPSAQIVPGTLPTQESPSEATTPPPSPNDVRELMRLLSEPAMVEWLRQQSEETDAGAPAETALSLSQEFAVRVSNTRVRVSQLILSWQNLSSAPAALAEAWRSEMSAGDSLRTITYVLIFLVIGGGLEWLYRQYTQATLTRLELRHRDTLRGRFQAALMRAVTIFGGLAVFAAGTIGAFLSFDWPPFVEELVLNLLLVVIVIRSAATLSLFLLAPRVASLRMVPLTSRISRPLHYWTLLLVTVGTVGQALSDIFDDLAGGGDAAGAPLAVSVSATLVFSPL